MATTRTFIALALPPEAKAALADLRRTLPAPPRGLRWSDFGQAHLTLRFLGDLDDDALAEARRRVRSAAAASQPFDADLRGLGAFPSPARARVAWVGWGEGKNDVVSLHGAVAAALAGIGRDDDRPPSPHVTIARARPPVDLRGWLEAAPPWSSPGWRVAAVDVMASELEAAGAVHTRIERCALVDRGS